jgi:hypothetical protein
MREQEDMMTVEQDTAPRVRGQSFVGRVRELIHEGNVRRLVIKDDHGFKVLEIPVTTGVVAAVVAPVPTAIGALTALANEWSIEVEPQDGTPATTTEQGSGKG